MYTNGFNTTEVLNAMRLRLGWRQSSGSPTLSQDNLESLSGRYFQSFHPLVTLANIHAVIEEPNSSDEAFNEYLTNLQDDAIMRCLNEVFREPELLEQKLLYTRSGQSDQPVESSNQFVGYMINVANDFGISTQINSVTLYLDGDCTFNLHLFQDGVKSAVKTIPVTVTAYERTVIDIDSLVLNYRKGDKYYFGYFQSDLGDVKAIQEQVDVWATTKCFGVTPFKAADLGGDEFDTNNKQFTSQPYGLNLEISSFRDHTQKILRKANFFDEAIGQTVALMVLEQIIGSTRSNAKERITQEHADKIDRDINQAFPTNELPVVPGLKVAITKEYEKLKKTFFPKAQAMSMNIESAGSISGYERAVIRQFTNPPVQ